MTEPLLPAPSIVPPPPPPVGVETPKRPRGILHITILLFIFGFFYVVPACSLFQPRPSCSDGSGDLVFIGVALVGVMMIACGVGLLRFASWAFYATRLLLILLLIIHSALTLYLLVIGLDQPGGFGLLFVLPLLLPTILYAIMLRALTKPAVKAAFGIPIK